MAGEASCRLLCACPGSRLPAALNMAVFLLIGKTSALTMNVAGVVKDWLLILLSVVLYGCAGWRGRAWAAPRPCANGSGEGAQHGGQNDKVAHVGARPPCCAAGSRACTGHR